MFRPGSGSRRSSWPFVVLVPLGLAGAWLASRLSRTVEAPPAEGGSSAPTSAKDAPGSSRPEVRRLATLFAVDAGGGGLVTASFLAYYLTVRYDASPEALGLLFFATSLLQALSVWVAPRLADRIGLVPTMVGTHLPSNVLLAAVAFAAHLRRRGRTSAGPHLPVPDGCSDPAGTGHASR